MWVTRQNQGETLKMLVQTSHLTSKSTRRPSVLFRVDLYHHIITWGGAAETLRHTHTHACTQTHKCTFNGDYLAGPKQSFSAGFVLSWTHLCKAAQNAFEDFFCGGGFRPLKLHLVQVLSCFSITCRKLSPTVSQLILVTLALISFLFKSTNAYNIWRWLYTKDGTQHCRGLHSMMERAENNGPGYDPGNVWLWLLQWFTTTCCHLGDFTHNTLQN